MLSHDCLRTPTRERSARDRRREARAEKREKRESKIRVSSKNVDAGMCIVVFSRQRIFSDVNCMLKLQFPFYVRRKMATYGI